MVAAVTTVAHLFAENSEELKTGLFSDEGGDHLREAVLKSDPAFSSALSTVTDEDLAGSVFSMLATPISDLLQSGWNQLVELQEYLDPDKHPPEETSKVGVAKHKLSTKWEPKLDVQINGKQVSEINFKLALALKIEGTVLTIRDGRVWGASAPRMTGNAELFCEGFRVYGKQSEKFELPGAITFKDGLPIPDVLG